MKTKEASPAAAPDGVKKKGSWNYLLHVLIGLIVIAVFCLLPVVEPLTKTGMIVIGLFVATNWWLATCGLIWPSILSLILYVVLTGASADTSAAAMFGTTTVWQVVMLLPICYAIKETGAIEVIARWIISRKVLAGRPMLFSYAFLVAFFFMGLMTNGSASAILGFVTFDGVAAAVGYKRGSKYYASMTVMVFLASVLGYSTIPYRGYINGMIASFGKITGYEMNGAYYIAFDVIFILIFLFLCLLVMRFIMRVDMSKLKEYDCSIVQKEGVGVINKPAKILLGGFGVLLLGILIPVLLPKLGLSQFINVTLTNNCFFALVLVVLCLIKVDGKHIINADRAFKDGIPWGLLFSMGIMLIYAGALSSDDLGVKLFLQTWLGNTLSGIGSIPMVIITICLTVAITGVFSNMATGIIMMSITLPLAASFNINEMALGLGILATSMYGFLSPGGNGSAPLIFGNENLTSKERYSYLIPFAILFAILGIALTLTLNVIL